MRAACPNALQAPLTGSVIRSIMQPSPSTADGCEAQKHESWNGWTAKPNTAKRRPAARPCGYHLLSMGSIRPACRKIDELRSTLSEVVHDIDTPEPLVPGTPVTLRFSLTTRPAVFKTGERLRLDIGSRTDWVRSDVAHGYEHFDMMVPPYFSRNTVHY